MNTKSFVIIGGGTAGSSAANVIKSVLKDEADVKIIIDPDTPTVGVGEATVGSINTFLHLCGLFPEKVCLENAKGTIKSAVHLKDWYQNNHSYFTPVATMGHELMDVLSYDISEQEFWKSHCGLRLALANKSPFMKKEFVDRDFQLPRIWNEYAYNIDASLLGNTLLNDAENKGVEICYKKVKDIVTDQSIKNYSTDTDGASKTKNSTIDYLILDDDSKITADFYIDCSGFSRLIPNSLNLKTKKFKELPNNRAWATQIPYENKETELPYLSAVECQTMQAGWRWQIGLKERIGTGYVFSTNYISEEDALQEFKDSFEGDRVKTEDCHLIKFETECYEEQSGDNWITCGLSAGFVEPLESTSIYFMHNNLMAFLHLALIDKLPADQAPMLDNQQVWHGTWQQDIVNYPPKNNNDNDFENEFEDDKKSFSWNSEKINLFNNYTFQSFNETVEYVLAHYSVSRLDHSNYWKDIKKYKQRSIDWISKGLGNENYKGFFSRPACALLCIGNRIKFLDNWTKGRTRVYAQNKQSQATSPSETLFDTRLYLGSVYHRQMITDQLIKYNYDIIDQHKWLDDVKDEKNIFYTIDHDYGWLQTGFN